MNAPRKNGIILWGASGRMGSELLRLLQSSSDFELAQAVVSPRSDKLGQPAMEHVRFTAPGPLAAGAGVTIDFSSPAAFIDLLDRATAARCPVVSGTTGLGGPEWSVLEKSAETIPIFWAPNFSLGLAALLHALRQTLPMLPGFEVEIVETHHSAKKDSPSGTALRIAEVVDQCRGQGIHVHGRHGIHPRSQREIGLHSVRGGSNPGRHEVQILGRSEDLILTHQVYSREVFALGALRAAALLLNAKPGLYDMNHLSMSVP